MEYDFHVLKSCFNGMEKNDKHSGKFTIICIKNANYPFILATGAAYIYEDMWRII